MSSTPVRVPDEVHAQATRLAALRGQQPGQFLADAWEEYLANHREDFATDLEQAARIVRDGTSTTSRRSPAATPRSARARPRSDSAAPGGSDSRPAYDGGPCCSRSSDSARR